MAKAKSGLGKIGRGQVVNGLEFQSNEFVFYCIGRTFAQISDILKFRTIPFIKPHYDRWIWER